VRAGKALLAGLLRCGHCGRKLNVSYWGKSGTTPTYRCKGTFEAGGTYCIVFGGAGVDRRFTPCHYPKLSLGHGKIYNDPLKS